VFYLFDFRLILNSLECRFPFRRERFSPLAGRELSGLLAKSTQILSACRAKVFRLPGQARREVETKTGSKTLALITDKHKMNTPLPTPLRHPCKAGRRLDALDPTRRRRSQRPAEARCPGRARIRSRKTTFRYAPARRATGNRSAANSSTAESPSCAGRFPSCWRSWYH
jgi:hypothetical protein